MDLLLYDVFQKYGGQLLETAAATLHIELSKGTERAETLRQEASLGKVIENRILTKDSESVKRHIGWLPVLYLILVLIYDYRNQSTR
jgi:hypothetical protein